MLSSTYNVDKNDVIELTEDLITFIGTTPSRGHDLMDNKRSTYYWISSSHNENCWFGIDLGEGSSVMVDKIHFSAPIWYTSNEDFRGMIF